MGGGTDPAPAILFVRVCGNDESVRMGAKSPDFWLSAILVRMEAKSPESVGGNRFRPDTRVGPLWRSKKKGVANEWKRRITADINPPHPHSSSPIVSNGLQGLDQGRRGTTH